MEMHRGDGFTCTFTLRVKRYKVFQKRLLEHRISKSLMSPRNMSSRHRRRSRGIAPLILHLAGGWSTPRPRRFTPGSGTPYPLYSRLDPITSAIPSYRSTRLGVFLTWRRKHSRHSKCRVSLKQTMDRVQGTNIMCHTSSSETDRAGICF